MLSVMQKLCLSNENTGWGKYGTGKKPGKQVFNVEKLRNWEMQ
jgi:hypothetical protein